MGSRTVLQLVVGARIPGSVSAREPSDVPKPVCPFCGSQQSRVYRSKGALRSDEYRRRRRCSECVDAQGKPRTWPTLEGLDKARFARELALEGLHPAELGLADVA